MNRNRMLLTAAVLIVALLPATGCDTDTIATPTMPDTVGLNRNEALQRLESVVEGLGLEVEVHGVTGPDASQAVVVSQSPRPGEPLTGGQVVRVTVEPIKD